MRSTDALGYSLGVSAAERLTREWRKTLRLLSGMASSHLQPDVISFSSAISSCERAAAWQHAVRVFDQMLQAQIQADALSYSAVISACEKGGHWQHALIFSINASSTEKEKIPSDVLSSCAEGTVATGGGDSERETEILMSKDVEAACKPRSLKAEPVYKTVLMCPPSSSRPKLPNYQNLTPWVRIFFFAHTYYAYIYTFYMFVFAFYKGYALYYPQNRKIWEIVGEPSDVGVMHELLFALLGYTGGLVVETPEGFTLAPQSFITEGERQLLEKTLKVGFYCKKLSDFTATLRRRHFANAGTETTSPGHYAYGLAVRIESALEKFREKVLELEDEVLEKPSLPLAYLLAKLEEDTVLLGVLHRLMTQVTTRSLRGAALLDLLWQAVACAGGPSLQRCLAEQLEGAGQVWVNQLVAWMVYGRLADPDHEFFVQRLDTSDQRSDLSLPGEALQEWHHLFQLREEAVPRTVITRNAAEKVLFTGKAVRVLIRSHCWSGQEEHLQRHVDTLRSCFSCKSPCNVLERCIGELKENANAQLLELLKRSRLVQTLQAMKGFYLLGYGAFYQMPGSLSVDLHSFDDENVKVMGGRLENGLVLMSPRSMVWLQTKVRISSSFQHVFNFQLRPKHRGGSAASTASRAFGEYGTRLALCFQPNRRLQERGFRGEWAGRMAAVDFRAEIVEPLETWRSLGECLAVEVTYCVLPHLQHRASAESTAEVTVSIFTASGEQKAAQLATTTLSMPDVQPMIHMVRVWYDSEKGQLEVFFGSDAVTPCCSCQLDLKHFSLEMGCSYVGLCCLPLELAHNEPFVRIMTWRHQTKERLDFEEQTAMVTFSDLTLSYQVPWPLPLIITQSCLQRYNRFFQQLLTYRRTALDLQRFRLDGTSSVETARARWAFKAQLQFFWSQVLQYFLQDVVEASHQKLMDAVAASQTFDEVTRAHEEFMSTVSTHLFLKAPELHKDRLKREAFFLSYRMQEEFVESVKAVISMMQSIHRHGRVMPLLEQLLARLEYNGYFETESLLS
eukprot:g24720.t1